MAGSGTVGVVKPEQVIAFEAPLPPRGLRVNSATKIAGWRAKLKAEYQEQVWCAAQRAAYRWTADRRDPGTMQARCRCPWERAVLRLEWHHAGVAPDQDNALASLKSLIDVLHTKSKRPLGIIVDDSPAHLQIEPVRLEKVRHRNQECVVVCIERVTT